MKIESDYFKTLEELIKSIKVWVREEDIYYDRWFGLNELNILVNEIERLNNIINKTKQYIKENILSFNEVDIDDIKVILDMLEDK